MKLAFILLICCGVAWSAQIDFKFVAKEFEAELEEARTPIQGTVAAPLAIWLDFSKTFNEIAAQPKSAVIAKRVPEIVQFLFFADLLSTLHLANRSNGHTIPFNDHVSVVNLTISMAHNLKHLLAKFTGNALQKLPAASGSRADESDVMLAIEDKCKKLKDNLDEAMYIIMKYDTMGAWVILNFHNSLMRELEASFDILDAAPSDRATYAGVLKTFIIDLRAIGKMITSLQVNATTLNSGMFYLVCRLVAAYDFPYLASNFATLASRLEGLSGEEVKGLILPTTELKSWTDNATASRNKFAILQANLNDFITNEKNVTDQEERITKRKEWLNELDKNENDAFVEPLNSLYANFPTTKAVNNKQPERISFKDGIENVGRVTEESIGGSKAA